MILYDKKTQHFKLKGSKQLERISPRLGKSQGSMVSYKDSEERRTYCKMLVAPDSFTVWEAYLEMQGEPQYLSNVQSWYCLVRCFSNDHMKGRTWLPSSGNNPTVNLVTFYLTLQENIPRIGTFHSKETRKRTSVTCTAEGSKLSISL